MDWNWFKNCFFYFFHKNTQQYTVLNLALSQFHASAHILQLCAIAFSSFSIPYHSIPFHLQHIYGGLLFLTLFFLSFNIQYTQFNWTFTLFGFKISHDRLLFFLFPTQFWPRDLIIFGLLALFNFQKGNDESTADTIINFLFPVYFFPNRHGSFV